MPTTRVHVRPRSRTAFRIAIICALKVEADAVLEVLDPESASWDSFGKAEGDNNSYTTGSINRHNVVVLYSGAGIPKTSAAAGNLYQSFPNVSLVLVVGVCGGVPTAADRRDIFLGDLVISSDAVHYTSQKQYPTGSARITRRDDELGKQQPEARNFVRKFELSTYQKKLQRGIQTELEKYHAIDPKAFPLYPGTSHDALFASDFQHMHRGTGACENGVCSTDGISVCLLARTKTCSELECGSEEGAYVRLRESASGKFPALSVHVGTFGTGDTVMKSGIDRDLIASKDSIDAFEMESAGVWDQHPTIVLKSVCDYADSHKNDDWHGYAAGVSALGLKVLLQYKELPVVDSATEPYGTLSLRDALTYPRRDAKLELIREDHIPPNSFDWVWSTTQWKSWLCTLDSGEDQLFWISGLPGSGKSTLMDSLAVDKRTMKYVKKANQSCKILRFFFDFRAGKDTANNRRGLLKLFISELWHVYDANAPAGDKLADRHVRDPVDGMSEGRLLDLLSEMVVVIPQLLLVFVDGLDEYEGEPHGLVNFLQKLRQRTSMHLCLASRPEPVFESAFRDCPHFAMQDHNEASVRMYIDYAIDAASSRLISPRMLINSATRQLIVSKAQGMIIWARLAVNELLREDRVDTTPDALRKVIDTLPQGLESLYEQTLSRLPTDNAPEVALILLIIIELGENGRIDDELLYGYFKFLSDRCPEVSKGQQIISDQSKPKRLHLYNMKARLRMRCGALVNTSSQEPGLYAGGSWSQTDDGDLVTFKRSFWHPWRREPRYNPPWFATLFHRTFHVYFRNSPAILHAQLPAAFRRQYPDAFKSRVYANVIAAATEAGDWNSEANAFLLTKARQDVRHSGLRLCDSLKDLFDHTFSAKLASWEFEYAIIGDSMRQMPAAMATQETCIFEPYKAWKEALASPMHFITADFAVKAHDDVGYNLCYEGLDPFLARSAEEKVLRLAVKWGLPRIFSEVYIEVTTSQSLSMPTKKWHELFSLTLNECSGFRFYKQSPNDAKDIHDFTRAHERRFRFYDDVFRHIIPHLVTFSPANLPQVLRTVGCIDSTSKSETDYWFSQAAMTYRALRSTRKLARSSDLFAQTEVEKLSFKLKMSLTTWICRKSAEGVVYGPWKSRVEIPAVTVEVPDQRGNLHTSYLSPIGRLCLGSDLMLLRLLSNNVLFLSRTDPNLALWAHPPCWDVFQLVLWRSAFKQSPTWQECDDEVVRACLVLFLVLVRLGVDPGNWHDHERYTRLLLRHDLTDLQYKVSNIMLFALRVRGQTGHWPEHETITTRDDWKQEFDRALSDSLVRAIDDGGNVALETLDKYHQSLLDDGIIKSE